MAQPGGRKTRAAGRRDTAAAPAAASAPAADASIDAILDALDQQIQNAVLGGQPLRGVLHVRNNDIELSVASRPSGATPALVGLELAMFGTEGRPSAALVHGNRITTPASDVTAAAIFMRDAQAVISVNLFTQLSAQVQSPVPCLVSSIVGGSFEVMANVITRATIQPARTPPPTNDWPFLNTIG
jgi:hypothetical protein